MGWAAEQRFRCIFFIKMRRCPPDPMRPRAARRCAARAIAPRCVRMGEATPWAAKITKRACRKGRRNTKPPIGPFGFTPFPTIAAECIKSEGPMLTTRDWPSCSPRPTPMLPTGDSKIRRPLHPAVDERFMTRWYLYLDICT